MQHESKARRAVLRIFPTDGRTGPGAFANLYFAGTFRQELRVNHTTISGWPAYEVHARELVGGSSIDSVTTFALRGTDMFVLSEVTPSDQAFSAKPDFAYLRNRLEFLD